MEGAPQDPREEALSYQGPSFEESERPTRLYFVHMVYTDLSDPDAPEERHLWRPYFSEKNASIAMGSLTRPGGAPWLRYSNAEKFDRVEVLVTGLSGMEAISAV